MPRRIAAKMIAEDRARVATEEEVDDFRKANREAKERLELEDAARRMHVTVMASPSGLKPVERS